MRKSLRMLKMVGTMRKSLRMLRMVGTMRKSLRMLRMVGMLSARGGFATKFKTPTPSVILRTRQQRIAREAFKPLKMRARTMMIQMMQSTRKI